MTKNWMCSIVLSCATILAGSQAFAQDPQTQAPGAGGAAAAGSPDAMFLHKAAEGGLLEIQLGQLAAQKSTNSGVQAFGQKMVQDHTALNDDMKPIAQSMGVTPPDHLDRRDQAKYDKLAALSGQEFDKAYIKSMVMDHRMDLHEFRHEESTTTNPQLKQAVAHGEQVITEHLHLATQLAQQNGVEVPSRGGAHDQATAPPAQ
jgi:putative membrane protein